MLTDVMGLKSQVEQNHRLSYDKCWHSLRLNCGIPSQHGCINHWHILLVMHTSTSQTVWYAWVYTQSITAERTISVLQTTLTLGALQAFSQDRITIILLNQYLPNYDGYIHANSNVVFITIGRHEDEWIDMLTGSSSNLGIRIGAIGPCQ